MVPREDKSNSYAKFWRHKQRVLRYFWKWPIPLTALNGEHRGMKIESVPMEFLTDFQVSCDHRNYERNLSNCIQKPEKVRTSIYFIYHFTLTDSVRLIHVWKVVCGHSLPFDVFFGTMTGVELFPGRDVFNSLDTQNLVPFSDTEISFNVSAVRAWLLWAETRLDQQEPQFER